MENDSHRKASPDYFRSPSLFWFLLIVPSMSYISILAYIPEIIPFDSLGPFGDFSLYLHKNQKIILFITFWAAWAVHFFEAVFVVKRAKDLGIKSLTRNKWFFQTLFVGYPSTRLMNIYYNKINKEN